MRSPLLLLAVLLSIASMAPASAGPRGGSVDKVATSDPHEVKCSWSSGQISPVQCGKRYAKDYESCRKYVIERGETAASALWWCTSQGYTN
jgi:hypothetical protein